MRKVVVAHMKKEQAKRLALRRPALFHGLELWNHKQHSRLLSLPPLKAALLLKLWSGSIMCKHKRSQVYGESSECPCGAPSQTVPHLLWSCPLVPPPPINIGYRRHLPSSQSVSHILPERAGLAEVRLWRQSCLRALDVLSNPLEAEPRFREDPQEARGHILATSEEGTYVFCRKCYIARRMRDCKWIFLKQCAHDHRSLEWLESNGRRWGIMSLFRWHVGDTLCSDPNLSA